MDGNGKRAEWSARTVSVRTLSLSTAERVHLGPPMGVTDDTTMPCVNSPPILEQYRWLCDSTSLEQFSTGWYHGLA
jgi:hypothetical protein